MANIYPTTEQIIADMNRQQRRAYKKFRAKGLGVKEAIEKVYT